MVSALCQSYAGLRRFEFLLNSKRFHLSPTTQIIPKQGSFSSVRIGTGWFGIRSDLGQQKPRTLFPGGYKRPEIKVPNLVLELSSEEVLSGGDVLDKVDVAISKWVGIVVLNGVEGSGGGKLYEAAVLLKSVVRDRAVLMVVDRVDIATAVNANGVVLSDQGLPTIVARSAMMDAKVETVMLPLVAKKVQSAKGALSASNSEGADFLLLDPIDKEKDLMDLVSSLSQEIKVPIFITCSLPELGDKLFRSGASGFVVSLKGLGKYSEGDVSSLVSGLPTTISKPMNGNEGARNVDVRESNNGSYKKDRVVGIVDAEGREKQFVEKEKVVLLEAIDVIKKAAPMVIF